MKQTGSRNASGGPKVSTGRVDPDALREEAQQHFEQGDVRGAVNRQLRLVKDARRSGAFSVNDHLALSAYLLAMNDTAHAIRILEGVGERGADDPHYFRQLGTAYQRAQNYEKAIEAFLRCRDLDPEMLGVHEQMALAYFRLGQRQQAVLCGKVALLLKAGAHDEPAAYEIPKRPAPRFDYARPARNIIAFDLPGASREHQRGALINATYAPVLFPSWRCRFYADEKVPREVCNELIRLGAEIAMVAAARGRFRAPGLWSLHVLQDRRVQRFLVRDPRAMLSVRDRVAVEHWLESGKWFHVMRDHPGHAELIVPGLWGGTNGVLPGVQNLVEDWAALGHTRAYVVHDLLDRLVWPTIRHSVCIHDSCFDVLDAEPFPEAGRMPPGWFVGQRIRDARGLPEIHLPESVRAETTDGGQVLSKRNDFII